MLMKSDEIQALGFGFPWTPSPDYRRILATFIRIEPDRVPLAELGVDPPVKALCLGRPGYEFPYTMPCTATTGTPGYGMHADGHSASASFMRSGAIENRGDLDNYPWPDPAGRLWEIIPDLISLGVDGLHPIEPKAMDINEVKRQYGSKLVLIGNIDISLMSLSNQSIREDNAV